MDGNDAALTVVHFVPEHGRAVGARSAHQRQQRGNQVDDFAGGAGDAIAGRVNVSRPFVIKAIEADKRPYRMVCPHRRIAFDDLIAYAQQIRRQQEEALDRMADNARELGLDD